MANTAFWSRAEWIMLDIRNWYSTDMCMGQEYKEAPRKDGLTW